MKKNFKLKIQHDFIIIGIGLILLIFFGVSVWLLLAIYCLIKMGLMLLEEKVTKMPGNYLINYKGGKLERKYYEGYIVEDEVVRFFSKTSKNGYMPRDIVPLDKINKINYFKLDHKRGD